MQRNYEFSIGTRFAHWVRAFAIFVLIFTGLYIGYVFISPSVNAEPTSFMGAKFRMVHQVAGFVLLGCFIFKCYLFLFDKVSGKERASLSDFISPKIWIEQIKFYLFLGSHPHLKGVYNPLQFITYVFFYIVLALLILTGFILYANVYHEGFGGFIAGIMKYFESLFGGLSVVRKLHHILMWVCIVFIPIHIYMAVFNSIKGKDGGVDSIIGGYKYQ